MKKEEQIRALHKILYIWENKEEQTSYDMYISNCIARFAGTKMDDTIREKIIDTLTGLKVIGNTLSHQEVRSIILGLMGDIDRMEAYDGL